MKLEFLNIVLMWSYDCNDQVVEFNCQKLLPSITIIDEGSIIISKIIFLSETDVWLISIRAKSKGSYGTINIQTNVKFYLCSEQKWYCGTPIYSEL